MPYWTHVKDTEPGTGQHYVTRSEAYTASCELSGSIITFVASSNELSTWYQRERTRFRDGTYTRVPWESRPELVDLHFAHLSIDCPGLIAYTIDAEHGVQDRQTRTKPGRYLQQFYADVFDAQTIARYVAECAAHHQTLQFATTAEDITAVYMSGPASCMDGEHFENMSVDVHPCTVYGAPLDLAVAYVGPTSHVSQRAVVWPSKYRWNRIYGTGPLEQLLRASGYAHGSMAGARIRAILAHGGYLMPYIDGIDHAKLDGQFLVLGNGPISTSETNGYSIPSQVQCCRNCGCEYEDEDTGDLCYSCNGDQWTCNHCEAESFDNSYCHHDGETLCESCYANLQTECASETCSTRWIEDDVFTDDEHATRVTRSLDGLCRLCASLYLWCDRCEVSYNETDECPDCGKLPRCTRTIDLIPWMETRDGDPRPYHWRDVEPTSDNYCAFSHTPDCPVACYICLGDTTLCPYGHEEQPSFVAVVCERIDHATL